MVRDLVAGDAHLELTHGDLEVAVVDDAGDASFAVEGLQPDEVAGLHGSGTLPLLESLVVPGGVGGDGAGELLGELAAEASHAEGRVTGDLLGDGLVVNGFDRVFELRFEVGEEGVEFGFELAGALLDVVAAFGVEALAFHADLVLAATKGGPLLGGGGKLGVKLVEEGANIGGLGGERDASVGDDVRREAEAGGDVEAGGGAGDAETELVGGRERFGIEADRGVDNAGVGGGVDLERVEMGGDERPGAAAEKVTGDGDGEGRAFFGIGGRAKLVEEDERVGAGLAGDAIDVGDMGGEGREIALDGLSVADVGVDGVENGQAGLGGGDGQAGLGHEAEQAEGLEADGLAAGVGARDDELAGAALEDEGERDERDALLGEAERKQGVASAAQSDRFAGVFAGTAGGREGGPETVKLLGEAGAGGERVEFGKTVSGSDEGVGMLADGAGHGDEDAVDLGLFFVEQAEELVVGLDGLHGLDEHGLAGGGGAVDDAGDATAELGLDRDGEAIAAERDEFFLRGALLGNRTERAAKGVLDLAVLALQGSADAGELGAGRVGERAVRLDLVAKLVEERGKRGGKDRFREGRDGGPAIAERGWRLGGQSAPGLGELGEVKQLKEFERFEGGTRDAGLGEEFFRIEEAGEGEGCSAYEQTAELVDAILLEVDPGKVGGGLEREGSFAAGGGLGTAGDELAQSRPLERGVAALAEGLGLGRGWHFL